MGPRTLHKSLPNAGARAQVAALQATLEREGAAAAEGLRSLEARLAAESASHRGREVALEQKAGALRLALEAEMRAGTERDTAMGAALAEARGARDAAVGEAAAKGAALAAVEAAAEAALAEARTAAARVAELEAAAEKAQAAVAGVALMAVPKEVRAAPAPVAAPAWLVDGETVARLACCFVP